MHAVHSTGIVTEVIEKAIFLHAPSKPEPLVLAESLLPLVPQHNKLHVVKISRKLLLPSFRRGIWLVQSHARISKMLIVSEFGFRMSLVESFDSDKIPNDN